MSLILRGASSARKMARGQPQRNGDHQETTEVTSVP